MTDLVLYGTPVLPFVRKVEAAFKTQGVSGKIADSLAIYLYLDCKLNAGLHLLGTPRQ